MRSICSKRTRLGNQNSHEHSMFPFELLKIREGFVFKEKYSTYYIEFYFVKFLSPLYSFLFKKERLLIHTPLLEQISYIITRVIVLKNLVCTE